MSELIAIFGGTFDPIHKGHLGAMALICKEIPFDRVHWVLSARPPHKDQTTASIEHRFAMMELALADDPRYIADDTEIKRQTKSYTIDTVTTFRDSNPGAQLFVIIGGDSLIDLPQWHRYPELIDAVNWVVMRRPGYAFDVPIELSERFVSSPADLMQHSAGKIWCFDQSDFDVSSTELRAELSQMPGKLAKEFLPSVVLNYIREHQLYKIERNL